MKTLMLKKITAGIIAAGMVLGASNIDYLPKITFSAYAEESEGFVIDENGVLTKYNGVGGNVVIPDSVTSIGWSAFYNCKSLTSITIPDSVTSIGGYAFSYCENLKSISTPDSVTSIGNDAFTGCTSLTSISIPDSVILIGDHAFQNCTSLTSVTIPGSVTLIGDNAFSNCASLTNINVDSNNSDYLGNDGILFNKNKTTLICYPAGKTDRSYTIPDSVISIATDAFWGCDSLTIITIPDSVTSIGDDVFGLCRSLTNINVDSNNSDYLDNDGILFNKNKTTLICYPAGKPDRSYTIPDSVTSIGNYAFYVCDSLTSITIPNSVTSIGFHAFDGCTSLTSITIPDSVTSIGYGAFGFCRSLTSITIPDSVSSIGFSAFTGCTSLARITIPDSVTSISDFAFQGCDSLTSITIPDSVTSIGVYAFYDCNSLTSITIPDSVISISDFAFQGCDSLTSITIPDSVTSIGNSAFEYCTNLTSITIPDSVISIGDSAFFCCTGLTRITIPNSVISLGDYAFNYCDSLTRVTIPDSVTSIGWYAFSDCTRLADIYYTGTEDKWNNIDKPYDGISENCQIHYNYDPAQIEEVTSELTDSSLSSLKTATGADDIKLVVTEAVPDEDVTVKIEKIVSDKSKLFYLDIELLKVVDGVESNITETALSVEIKIELPDDLKAAAGISTVRDYQIVRVHNGVAEILEADYDGTYLTFETNKFSDYAIVYTDLPYGDVNGDGNVTLHDLLRLGKSIAGIEGTTIYKSAADVNADGKITLHDLLRLGKSIAGIDGVILGQA